MNHRTIKSSKQLVCSRSMAIHRIFANTQLALMRLDIRYRGKMPAFALNIMKLGVSAQGLASMQTVRGQR